MTGVPSPRAWDARDGHQWSLWFPSEEDRCWDSALGRGRPVREGKALGSQQAESSVTHCWPWLSLKCSYLSPKQASAQTEVLTTCVTVLLLGLQGCSVREHSRTSSQALPQAQGPGGCQTPGWAPLSTWEPAWGHTSRCWFVPRGVWPPCFLPTFHSLLSASLWLRPRRPVLRGHWKHTRSQSTPCHRPKWSSDPRGNACPPAGSQAPGNDTEQGGHTANRMTAICPWPAGTRHFTHTVSLVFVVRKTSQALCYRWR